MMGGDHRDFIRLAGALLERRGTRAPVPEEGLVITETPAEELENLEQDPEVNYSLLSLNTAAHIPCEEPREAKLLGY